MSRQTVTVVGAGPVGALLAICLNNHGYRVSLYEGRPDSRTTDIYQGRSINIALSDRGWTSLDKIGVGGAAKQDAIPMYHRAIHDLDGALSSIAYGGEDEAIWSVSRSGINETLLDIAEARDDVEVYFEHRLEDVSLETGECRFRRGDGTECTVTSDLVFGADGANSKVRRIAHDFPRFSYSQSYMDQCYLELNIPPNPDGSHQLEANALHIWPRGEFMLIALPNPDGSFTCTLFMNYEGEDSFAELKSPETTQTFFEKYFADVVDLLDDPVEEVLRKEASPLYLVRVFPWTFNSKVALIGDAAHAIVPFYGQGMNCGFEDCAVLNDLIEELDHDWSKIFKAYEQSRKPNGDAIAELATRNYVEMSDLSGDPLFQLRKKIEAKFSERYPDLWTPLYSMVTFSPDLSYAEALRLGDLQEEVMQQIMAREDIEVSWDSEAVMAALHHLAVEKLGDA